MQLVVVTAVNAAVNAAITTRMRISQMFLFSFIIDKIIMLINMAAELLVSSFIGLSPVSSSKL